MLIWVATEVLLPVANNVVVVVVGTGIAVASDAAIITRDAKTKPVSTFTSNRPRSRVTKDQVFPIADPFRVRVTSTVPTQIS